MRFRAFVLVAFIASSARAEPTQEVVVRGRSPEPGSTTLTNAELRTVPGAFGDPFRALEALPGTTPMQSGTPYMILRGAPPGNTAFLVDGVPVPLLFHLAIGPAILPTELIDRVHYFVGGAPAQFGRAVGGVVSAETRAPSERLRAYGQVRFFDASALVESPLAGGRGYALAAGRYSYTAAALSLLSPSVDLDYSDYQARAGLHVDDRDELSVFAFGSHDRRGKLGDFTTTYGADFHRVDLRFDRKLANGGRLRIATTLGHDASSNEQGGTTGRSARIRLELDQPIDETARLRAGIDGSFTRIDKGRSKQVGFDSLSAIFYPEHSDTLTGVFLDAIWRPVPKLEIIPGARVDLYSWSVADDLPREMDASLAQYLAYYNAPLPGETTAVGVDPRLTSRFKARRDITILATVGLYHQGPSFFAPSPALQPAGFQRGLQSAFQRSAGVELALPAELVATTTVFSHEYRNATAFTTCTIPKGGFDLGSPCIGARSNGGSVGVEVLVKTPVRHRIGGFLAYTLSRSVDEPVDPSRVRVPRGRLPTGFDHTHVLNVVASVDLGRRWNAGARLFLFTGRRLPGKQNERSGTFARLDVRIEKRWPLFRDGWLAVVAEMLNATFAREDGVDCTSARGCIPTVGPPVVIPSLGIEGSM